MDLHFVRWNGQNLAIIVTVRGILGEVGHAIGAKTNLKQKAMALKRSFVISTSGQGNSQKPLKLEILNQENGDHTCALNITTEVK